MCVCVCVCVVWCICIHNCLASCRAPIRGSIPPGHEGGEVFCYADTIGNCRPAKNLKMWLPVCAEPLFTSSGRESRRVLLNCFVAIDTGNRQSRGQPSRKRRHSGLRCISGKRLNCARSPSDVFFDHRFVGLATRKPSIAISSLVAAYDSNPTFRHGTSDDMRAFLSRNRGRV